MDTSVLGSFARVPRSRFAPVSARATSGRCPVDAHSDAAADLTFSLQRGPRLLQDARPMCVKVLLLMMMGMMMGGGHA
eukprot:1582518-Rhodomonas_salina.4